MNVVYVAAICSMPACSAALEDSASLADAASYTSVNVVVDDSRISVELLSTKKSCLRLDAHATVGGLPMDIEDHGHAQTGAGTSVGEVVSNCIPPSFVLHRSRGLPELPGPVDIAITDASSTYVIRLTDGLTHRSFAVTDPPDGKLHVGKSVTLSMPTGASPLTAAHVECTDANGHFLFTLKSDSYYGEPAPLQIGEGTFTFVVPDATKPQAVQLGLAWDRALSVESCKGPSRCTASESHSPVADPSSGVALLTIEP